MRHFLSLADFTGEELQEILELAIELKEALKAGGNRPLLKDKVLAMVFQKPSLRTRVSFDMAMRHLGGDALYLSPAEIGLGKREAIADVSRVLSRYVDAIMARVFDHEHILELARYSRVPVINGLSDFNHPCQAMADVLTILETYGDLRGLNVAFIGDGNNVAVREAHVIYTDTWASMGQETETEERRKVFQPYQVNAALVAEATEDVIVMHCLPAHRGEEITDEVADGPHSVLFDQAENRLHAQKAILVRLLT